MLDKALADIQAKYYQWLQMENVDVEVKDNDKSYHPSGDESDEDKDEEDEAARFYARAVQLANWGALTRIILSGVLLSKFWR